MPIAECSRVVHRDVSTRTASRGWVRPCRAGYRRVAWGPSGWTRN